MLIPEIILYNTVVSLIKTVEADYEAQTDKTRTFLNTMFTTDDNNNNMSFGDFNFLEQAKNLLLKKENSARRVAVSVGYNTERVGLPTIHITLPGENNYEKGIGYGQGYQDDEIDEYYQEYRKSYTDAYTANFNLILTSDNSSEVVLLYNFLKNCFVAINDVFELNGLRDIKFSGQDLQMNQELVPVNVYHRNLLVNFFYESTMYSLNREKFALDFKSNQTVQQTTAV